MASRRIKKDRDTAERKVARQIELASPHLSDFTLTDKRHHNNDDTRDTMRSGAKQTLRRLTRIERLVKLEIIDKDQANACQWYSDCHELGFIAQQGVTANYGGAGGGGCTAYDLLARHKAQQEARDNYAFAKSAIPHELVQLFEQTIFGTIGENEFRAVTRNEQFRIGLAAWRLHGQVSHLIAVAA